MQNKYAKLFEPMRIGKNAGEKPYRYVSHGHLYSHARRH